MNKNNRLKRVSNTDSPIRKVSDGSNNAPIPGLTDIELVVDIPQQLDIRISFRTSGTPSALLSLTGNVLKSNLKLLRSAFDECIHNAKNIIIIDMNNVDIVSSDGWRYIVSECKKLQHKKIEMFLYGIQPKANAVLMTIQGNDSLRIFSTIKEIQMGFESTCECKHDESQIEIQTKFANDNKSKNDDFVTELCLNKEASAEVFNQPADSEIEKIISEKEDYEELGLLLEHQTNERQEEIAPDVTNVNVPGIDNSKIENDLHSANIPDDAAGRSSDSVVEKITTIISMYGPCTHLKILSHLHSEQFGKEKVGLFKLIRILKETNLDTREKRVRFYRSC